MHFLRECFDDLDALLEDYRKLGAEAESARVPASALARVREREERIDLADIREGVPEALGRTLEGVERISSIVKAMKDFSHAGCAGKAPADLNDAIETTLALARHEYRYVADVTTELGVSPSKVVPSGPPWRLGGCRSHQCQGGFRMKLHGNARTCLRSRCLAVGRVEQEGWTLARAAEAAGV